MYFRHWIGGSRLGPLLALFTTALGLNVLCNTNASAQDFDRYRPNPPAVTPTIPELPEPADNPVEGSTEELVAALKGVMIIDHESRVQDPIKPFDGVKIDPGADLTVAREKAFKQLVQQHLGQPISIRSLNEMARNIVLLYRDYKQPVVDVSMPPGQDITDGIVQVVITESRIGDVKFRGNCYFDDCLLEKQGWLRTGQRIFEPCLQQELIWYNQNPFRDVGVKLEPGSEAGTTDIVYEVQDERPLRAYVGYEDSGTRATGLERINTGFIWGNAFGKDAQLSYQYTTDADLAGRIKVHSFVYQQPIFENRDTFMLFGSWADIDTLVDTPFADTHIASTGSSWQLSGRYRHTLHQTSCQVDQLQFGFDTKGSNNFADFNGANLSGTNVHIVQFTAGFTSQQNYDDGRTLYSIDVFASPGNMLKNNKDNNFKLVRNHSDSTYAYARGYIERMYDLDCQNDFVVRLTGQVASGELLPTEQLGFGGFNTIRGYDMRSFNGDNGYILNLEYRSKPVHGCFNGKDTSLTVYSFGDMGQQHNWQSSPVHDEFNLLASVGVGARYLIDPNCTIRFDYGFPITQRNAVNANEYGRVHLGATIAY